MQLPSQFKAYPKGPSITMRTRFTVRVLQAGNWVDYRPGLTWDYDYAAYVCRLAERRGYYSRVYAVEV